MTEKQRCSRCGERDGVVTLNTVEGTEIRTHQLCAKCAAEKGIQTVGALADTPLGGLLAALAGEGEAVAALADPSAPACPKCGATLQDFRETGHLGCSVCYTTFAEALRELLRRLHGSAHHTGTTYTPPGAEPSRPPTESPDALRGRLKQAIDSEAFELAAELRDRLKEHE